jgi:hypothetical protein
MNPFCVSFSIYVQNLCPYKDSLNVNVFFLCEVTHNFIIAVVITLFLLYIFLIHVLVLSAVQNRIHSVCMFKYHMFTSQLSP